MTRQMYLEFPLKPQHANDFSNLWNSESGFALTKKQPGFVSAEWMISSAEDGSKCFHLWKKWRSRDDFAAYIETPERALGSVFDSKLMEWGAWETKVFWGEVHLV